MPEEQEAYGDDLQKYESRQPAVIPPDETTPSGLLAIAVKQGADLEYIRELMNLKREWEADEARKAYVAAMAEFKKNPPEIIKDMTVSFDTSAGTTSYDHASLANVTSVIGSELSKHGLSSRWDVEQDDFGIKVTFILTHIAGHSESVSMIAPPDSSGKKNPIQSIASTVSYLERYTMLAGTGLAAKGMDTDGKLPEEEPEPINQDQIDEIEKLIKKAGIDDAEKETKLKNRMQELYGTPAIDRLNTEQAEDLKRNLKATVDFKAVQAKERAA